MEESFVTIKQIDIPMILDGTKTQFISKKGIYQSIQQRQTTLDNCPFGENGSMLLVREGFAKSGITAVPYFYKATYSGPKGRGPYFWKSPVNMTKEASRIKLQILRRRILNLQDLTEQDYIAQGIRFDVNSGYYFMGGEIMAGSYEEAMRKYCGVAHFQYPEIRPEANPTLWAVDFRLVSVRASVSPRSLHALKQVYSHA